MRSFLPILPILPLLLALLPTTLASPTFSPLSTLQTLHTSLRASPTCALPSPPSNCAGAPMKDVIVLYGASCSPAQKELFLHAAKAAGGHIVHELATLGYAGFVPEPVVNLLKAHGEGLGVKIHDNACFDVPWCGEAPC